MLSALVSVILSLLFLGALGSWLVHRADQTFALCRTCRYRDFYRLRRRAENFSLSYAVTALMGFLWYPAGLLVTLWVFGYAFYRRTRPRPLNF